MKIIHIVPGSGGTFYCQNCMRDSALVKALRRRGHDVLMVPLYLPLFSDDPDVTQDAPVFFGGINVYLQQKFKLFRKTPRWLDKLLDTRWILKQAAKREGSTDAAALGDMTLSMLNGEHGHQRKELDRLVTWLKQQEKPDLIHISNSLLIGMAERLKQVIGVPIVCSLQDEHTWLDDMHEQDRVRCWNAMAEEAKHVDRFVAVSTWYAQLMIQRLHVPESKMSVVYAGIELPDHPPDPLPTDPPVIGYLSRITAKLGAEDLVKVFLQIKTHPSLERARLRLTGGITPADTTFVAKLRQQIDAAGYGADVDILEHFERPEREAFLRSLTVMCVPVRHAEAFGTFITEALARGVPVVEPNIGAFPEIIQATGGGLLYEASNSKALRETLEGALLEADRLAALGNHGREVVERDFSIETMAENMETVYETLAKREGI